MSSGSLVKNVLQG